MQLGFGLTEKAVVGVTVPVTVMVMPAAVAVVCVTQPLMLEITR